MKIPIQVTITYSGYVHTEDYMEAEGERPSLAELRARIVQDAKKSPKYLTDRFKALSVEVRFDDRNQM